MIKFTDPEMSPLKARNTQIRLWSYIIRGGPALNYKKKKKNLSNSDTNYITELIERGLFFYDICFFINCTYGMCTLFCR